MISAFLIVRNEAANLAACLETIAWADEIVVVDSGSDDGTPAVARRFTARVVERPFTDFADQKNFALAQVRGDWALSVDADERVTAALRDEILRTVAAPGDAAAFRLARRNLFRGQWMRASWPDRQVRVLRPGRCRFAGVVHESVEVDGPVRDLVEPLVHEHSPTVAAMWRKIGRYAALDAGKRRDAGEPFGAASVALEPLREFRRLVFTRRAWRDGWNGILFAALLSFYAGAVAWHGVRRPAGPARS